jgi:hypothetical protein
MIATCPDAWSLTSPTNFDARVYIVANWWPVDSTATGTTGQDNLTVFSRAVSTWEVALSASTLPPFPVPRSRWWWRDPPALLQLRAWNCATRRQSFRFDRRETQWRARTRRLRLPGRASYYARVRRTLNAREQRG